MKPRMTDATLQHEVPSRHSPHDFTVAPAGSPIYNHVQQLSLEPLTDLIHVIHSAVVIAASSRRISVVRNVS